MGIIRYTRRKKENGVKWAFLPLFQQLFNGWVDTKGAENSRMKMVPPE